ncbi:hypothetical protein TNCV_4277371 [Trichonephila clavipes]|nr:hypothetical protein TNCV_4277371 [Trichonephila clavipes]
MNGCWDWSCYYKANTLRFAPSQIAFVSDIPQNFPSGMLTPLGLAKGERSLSPGPRLPRVVKHSPVGDTLLLSYLRDLGVWE